MVWGLVLLNWPLGWFSLQYVMFICLFTQREFFIMVQCSAVYYHHHNASPLHQIIYCRALRHYISVSSHCCTACFEWKKLMGYYQRWKNVWMCEQFLCRMFSSLGKILAKFYAALSQKWVMLRFCAFWWHFLAHFGTFLGKLFWL